MVRSRRTSSSSLPDIRAQRSGKLRRTSRICPDGADAPGDFTAFTSPACNGGRQITLRAPFVNNTINPSAVQSRGVENCHALPKTERSMRQGALTAISFTKMIFRFRFEPTINSATKQTFFARYLLNRIEIS